VDQPASVRSSNKIGQRGQWRLHIRFLSFTARCALRAGRSGNMLQRQATDVRFITLEEERSLSVFFYLVNLAMITRSDVESSVAPIERQIPDVLGLRIEEDSGFIVLINGTFALWSSFRRCCYLPLVARCGGLLLCVRARDLVHLAVRRGGGVKRTLVV